MIFCDISKAFDRVWHKGLLFKLKQNGIDGLLLQWIENYLSNRTQQVILGQSISNKQFLKAGVPQGSILGPLFFLVYVNDITENLLSITRLFADDTSLSQTTSNIADLEGILNHDLQVISFWSRQWLVTFNPDKTEVLFFTNSNNLNKPVLFFEGSQLKFSTSHKHLGVTLNENGKWHDHIENIVTSASKVLNIMRALKFKINRKALNTIYISFMRPLLEYASVVWDGCAEYEKDRLEKLQYEAARVVTGLTRSVSINNLINEIGWTSLQDRRSFQKLVIMYKNKNQLLPQQFSSIFPNLVGENNNYNLRNANNFEVMSRRTTLFTNSFVPSAVNLWNNLPEHIKNSESISIFKNRLIREFYNPRKIPLYYSTGSRPLSVYHARLRNGCSNLNSDLCRNHIRNTSECVCGHEDENAEHYFFNCSLYVNQRIALFHATRSFHPLNLNTLLYGNQQLSDMDNTCIFIAVQKFIKETKRFAPQTI
jgi:hypothetical protein